jgi:hypothetical protein
MSSSHKARLDPAVFHSHIKYHVAGDLLVCGRHILLVIQDIERNPDILNFLVNGILTQSVGALLV